MNEFRNRTTGEVVTEVVLRNSFPETGFPEVLTSTWLDPIDYDPVLISPKPDGEYGKLVVPQDVVQDANGNWVREWAVIDIPAEQFAMQLATDRQRVWEQIKAERDTRKAGGLKLDIDGSHYWFWTDDPSRNQYAMLDSMIRRNNLQPSFKLDDWKTMSGAFVPFTVALLYQVIDTGIANESALFRIAETHRQGMLAAANPNTYNWHTGWPETYEEFVANQQPA